VAPGNRVVGALSSNILGFRNSWNRLVTTYPQLATVPGAAQAPNQTLMELSGTSVAAPVVSGAVALMLQANPGLTPPLVKAILSTPRSRCRNRTCCSKGPVC
jgi:serine protease AprX